MKKHLPVSDVLAQTSRYEAAESLYQRIKQPPNIDRTKIFFLTTDEFIAF
ncbi:hypothetical protein [uncultured Nitrosomonas sp.]|nr:hypothetical protein [uncultured Nitrosomonas sp.]